jgi:hypothetical protein
VGSDSCRPRCGGRERNPYKPEALKKKQENFEHSLTRDPAGKCYLPGVTRATYMPFPFRIVPSTNEIMMLHEFAGATRTIHVQVEGFTVQEP